MNVEICDIATCCCLKERQSSHQIHWPVFVATGYIGFNLKKTQQKMTQCHSESVTLIFFTFCCNVFVCSVNLPTSGWILAFSVLNCSIFSFSIFLVIRIFSTAVSFCCNFSANISAYLKNQNNFK